MEFLVNININPPATMAAAEWDQLATDERKMAARLAEQGHLKRMWRVPGRRENWGLWEAADPTEIHKIISGLPVWPYMDVRVYALGAHPVDPRNPATSDG